MAHEEAKNEEKTLRRDFMSLWQFVPNEADGYPWKELDRFMIAMHRFQTEGKVAYRRICGMHGGGGGTSDGRFKNIMEKKSALDIGPHYQDDEFPDGFFWPEPVPNAPKPGKQPEDNLPFTYTFCWHAEPQFIVWHRPLVAEFERQLQEYDPQTFYPPEKRHIGSEALGLPYWAWEEWNGQALPVQFTMKHHQIRSTAWECEGYKKGHRFANPLRRWFAPVSVRNQIKEYFPRKMNRKNCTTRAEYFQDIFAPREGTIEWIQENGTPANPAIHDVVQKALQTTSYMRFATMKYGVGGKQFSIENAHNKIHNYIGGQFKKKYKNAKEGYPFGTDAEVPYTGTMGQNQSIFDPIFWLHHSNVDRQLCSWQIKTHGVSPEESSKPPSEVAKTVLYPWTKPDDVRIGEVSWNNEDSHGTFSDWFNVGLPKDCPEEQDLADSTSLTYKYDVLHDIVPRRFTEYASKRVSLAARIGKTIGGEFAVYRGDILVASISVLTAVGTGCAKCGKKENLCIDFDVTHDEVLHDAENSDVKQGGSIELKLMKIGIDTPVHVYEWTLTVEND